MKSLIHRILYHTLSLEGYLRVVSRLFFLWQRLGIGRYAPATEYVYHLPQARAARRRCIDIGANLGYYARTISRLAGSRRAGSSPWSPSHRSRKVLCRNLRRCRNVEILPYALGAEERDIVMGNDSARESGYLGTGQNFVNDAGTVTDVTFTARMRRGSVLFASLPRLDFIKCDIEGYELVVMREMRPVLERFRPTVLIETGGGNRPEIIRLFTELGYKGLHARTRAGGSPRPHSNQRHHFQTCALTSYPRFPN